MTAPQRHTARLSDGNEWTFYTPRPDGPLIRMWRLSPTGQTVWAIFEVTQ